MPGFFDNKIKMEKYELVYGLVNESRQFESTVNAYLSQGYQLVGGVSVVNATLWQAVAKPKKEVVKVVSQKISANER